MNDYERARRDKREDNGTSRAAIIGEKSSKWLQMELTTAYETRLIEPLISQRSKNAI